MALAHRTSWLDRFGTRRRAGVVIRSPIVASRDLPPLPRSPQPIPDEALTFARNAAQRVAETIAPSEATGPALSIADGADLRAMLERIEQASKRRESRDQVAQARARIVEHLKAGKANSNERPPLQLVRDQQLPSLNGAESDLPDLDRAMAEALASALGTLRQISGLAKD